MGQTSSHGATGTAKCRNRTHLGCWWAAMAGVLGSVGFCWVVAQMTTWIRPLELLNKNGKPNGLGLKCVTPVEVISLSVLHGIRPSILLGMKQVGNH